MQNQNVMDSLKDSIKSAAKASVLTQDATEQMALAHISGVSLTMNELNELYNYSFTIGAPGIRQAIADRMRMTDPSDKEDTFIQKHVQFHRYQVYAPACA